MSARATSVTRKSSHHRIRWLLATATALLLAACGASDGDIGVGSGQDPDPVVLDFPIAYTKGPLRNSDGELQSPTDLRDLERFNVGTDLYLLDRASPSAPETNITGDATLGLGDVQGVEISVDGERILFSMRGPFDESLDLEEQPTWNVWEYDIPAATLRRIIVDDLTAEEGHDIHPHYLADGRIIFSSTRQSLSKAVLVDENKQQFVAQDESFRGDAYVLHVMDSNGGDLTQVSFNQSHDLDPALRDNGKVIFTRWDNAGGNDSMHVYQMNPDGSALELLYGAESHATGTGGSQIQFVGVREMEDGRLMAIARQFDIDELGGDVIAIDAVNFVENNQPVVASAGMPGPAQQSVTPNQVRTDDEASAGGRFSSAFPLWDGTQRVLTSWSLCRLSPAPLAPEPEIVPCTDDNLANPALAPADPLYGIWMYDPTAQTQLPVVVGEEGVLIGEVVAAQPRGNPRLIPDLIAGTALEQDLVAEDAGILNIRSVYDFDGVDTANPDIPTLADPAQTTPDERPRRFLRIEKAVSIPDDDIVDLNGRDFGPNQTQGMREIVGYVPIEPDGSVRVKVPANVALAVSVLDVNARRVSQRHQNWIQVVPGQELSCIGCHSPFSGTSHGRSDSFASAYAGAGATGVAFPNTVAAVSPDAGETMAEARTRVSCQADDCAALNPSLDVIYDEFWTDADPPDPDDGFAYRYASLASVLPSLPVNKPGCLVEWDTTCRSIINYETHIHPLFGADRRVLDPADNTTVLADYTCTRGGCHIPLKKDLIQPAPPAAQLDLSDGLSPEVMDHFNSYRELLFFDRAQEVVNGALEDIVAGTDINGNPIFVPVAPAMSASGANASNDFFAPFEIGSHVGFMSADELRLISEWLDLGAQYYNNPFDVPE